MISYVVTLGLVAKREKERDGGVDMVGAKPMLLWYDWIRLRDGAWHRLDDISKQLHLPKNAIEWAARYLCEKGVAEKGLEENQIRIQAGGSRFEDAVRQLPASVRIQT